MKNDAGQRNFKRRSPFRILIAAAAFALLQARPSLASLGDCGQPFSSGAAAVTSDSLYILQTAVSLRSCDACVCDTNNSGKITAVDALASLRHVLGLNVSLTCPLCFLGTSSSTSTSSTSTTLACPSASGLDGVTFIEVYTCVQAFTGQSTFCADQDASDSFKFTHKGSGVYEVRDVPDTGFVYNGTLTCTTFVWNATSPDGYTESGTWEFNAGLTSFAGSSTYLANNSSYQGSCNETGATSPTIPPNPPTISPCL